MTINLNDMTIEPAPDPIPPFEVIDEWLARIRKDTGEVVSWSDDELLYYLAGCETYEIFYSEVTGATHAQNVGFE